MSSPISNSVQGHLTLALPMRSAADGQALRDKVPGVMPAFSKAADAVGTLHYYRLIALDATRFLFLAEYDGELEAIVSNPANRGSSCCWMSPRIIICQIHPTFGATGVSVCSR